MEFLKAKELKLNEAGYLVSAVTGKPINNNSYYKQQKAAEYVVKLAEKIKDKNFKQVNVDCLDQVKKELTEELSTRQSYVYVNQPSEPKSKVFDDLVNYALKFSSFEDEKLKTNQINENMNEFNTIYDVENVGEYFNQEIVKLNKIYTIKEILNAVTEISNKVG
jgi:hypothetical protein